MRLSGSPIDVKNAEFAPRGRPKAARRRPSGRSRLRRGLDLLERAPLALAGENDAVALDHLVEGRGFEAEEAGCVLLHAPRGLERRLDEPALEAGDHVAQADALGRDRDLRDVEARGG